MLSENHHAGIFKFTKAHDAWVILVEIATGRPRVKRNLDVVPDEKLRIDLGRLRKGDVRQQEGS